MWSGDSSLSRDAGRLEDSALGRQAFDVLLSGWYQVLDHEVSLYSGASLISGCRAFGGFCTRVAESWETRLLEDPYEAQQFARALVMVR